MELKPGYALPHDHDVGGKSVAVTLEMCVKKTCSIVPLFLVSLLLLSLHVVAGLDLTDPA